MKETEVRSRWIITGIVFAVCVVVLAVLMRGVRRNTLDQLREVCRLNEQASVNELNENISGCKDITETLDLLLQEGGNGEIHEFDSLCRKIMAGKNEACSLHGMELSRRPSRREADIQIRSIFLRARRQGKSVNIPRIPEQL